MESYPSESEADIALCGQLAFWTGCDMERMEYVVSPVRTVPSEMG